MLLGTCSPMTAVRVMGAMSTTCRGATFGETATPVLFDTLKRIVEGDQRSVDAIEESGILKGARFSNDVLLAPAHMCSPAKYRERGA